MSKEQGSESAVSRRQSIKEDEMAEEKEAPKKLSRRQFVKGAAVGGAGVAAAGVLASCAPAATPTPAPAPTCTCPPGEECAECAPCPVAGVPEKWDQETDVVVVGTGAGLPAAVKAAEGGAEVIVLEKNDWVGGLWISGGGHGIIGATHIQEEAGIEDSVEAWYEDEMAACQYRGVPEIIQAYTDRGEEFVQWMESLGCPYAKTLGHSGAYIHRVPRSHYPGLNPAIYPSLPGATKSYGIAHIFAWQKKLEELGVPILLEHRMRSIYREPGGPVLGVSADTPDGTINIKARKAVILGTGSWTDNYRMVGAWDPRAVGPDCYGDGGIPSDGTLFVDSAGDGHLAAAAIGAGFSDMSNPMGYQLQYGGRSYWGWEPPDFTQAYKQGGGAFKPRGDVSWHERVIVVKGDGARWINEIEGAREPEPQPPGFRREVGDLRSNIDWPFPAAFLSIPQPRNVWAVADSESATALEWPVEDLQNPNPKTGRMFDPACVAITDTLADLADKMGIPAAALEETVSRYNGFVDAGEDADFGKPMPMYKIATPPFYGLKCSLVRHTARNGLRVNPKSQVLEQSDQIDGYSGRSEDGSISINEEKVLPHLYAVGETANVCGWRGPHGSMGGPYAIMACIAGEIAAEETSLG